MKSSHGPSVTGNRWLIIGVGNIDRGDDATGLEVARRLVRLSNSRILIAESNGDAGELIEMWNDAKRVILVDAMLSGSPPGTVRRFDLLHETLPHSILRSSSTHDLGIAQAVELSRALGTLPDQLVLFGIEGKHFDLGAGICLALEEAIEKTIAQIHSEFSGSNGR